MHAEELRQWLGEGHRHGDDRPAEHDAGDPKARAVAVQQQIAGHLEEEVAPEEHAGAKGVDGIAEAEVAQHVQLGEADVDAIQVGGDVAQQQDRQDAQHHLAVGTFFEGVASGALGSGGLEHGNDLRGLEPIVVIEEVEGGRRERVPAV
ncbi:hypothetical protein Q3H58_001950 [Pseudomonas psychrotolerans]|nr:hypothetical protein [Pseudomonas psychrotolerans]